MGGVLDAHLLHRAQDKDDPEGVGKIVDGSLQQAGYLLARQRHLGIRLC
jgi:hypothetical protein